MERNDISVCVELMLGECLATKNGKRCSSYHPKEILLDSARKEFAKKNTTRRITKLCRNYNMAKCIHENCPYLHIKKEKICKISPEMIIKENYITELDMAINRLIKKKTELEQMSKLLGQLTDEKETILSNVYKKISETIGYINSNL